MSAAAARTIPARWRATFPSLGARLVGLFLVLAVAVAITFTLGTHVLQRAAWHETLRPLLMNYTDTLVAEIGSPPDIERARLLTQRLPLHIRIEGPQVNWDSADEPLLPPTRAEDAETMQAPRHPVVTLPNGDPLPLVVPGPRRPPRLDSGFEHVPPEGARPGPHGGPHRLSLTAEVDPTLWRVVRRLPDGHRITFSLADMSHEARAEHIGWATLATLLLLTALAYGWVRHMLHPLVALREGAVRYGQGDFSRPIVPRNRDELGDLAEQINAMAARLHHMLDAKRQLLLAISHELRSPLARARMNAELIDESGERSALLRDLGEMRDLITDLLESERLADVQAGGHAALQTQDRDAVGHRPRAMRRAGRRGDARAAAGRDAAGAAAGSRPHPPAAAQPHRQRVAPRRRGRARRRWCRPPVPPQAVQLVVRDFGPGMDDSQLQHAAEAFYRADAARLRSTGGVGLGLYLCKLVAEAHGGTLDPAQRPSGSRNHGHAAAACRWLKLWAQARALPSKAEGSRIGCKEPSMNTPRFLLVATLVAVAGAAQAQVQPQAPSPAASADKVNLDGSTQSQKKPTLSSTANHQLQQASVPSARTEPVDVKAQADADIANRDARAKGPRLEVQRQNLKGADAAHVIAQQTTPNTIDRDTAYGDKDHTEQVTDLKITLKK